MRFSKAEVLEAFDREDTSYRLAVLSSHWLRDTARFKPNVADQARGLKMQVRGRWISYTDIADKFKQQKDRDLIVSDFLLTQLHNLIRAPLEILCDYCDDYDKHDPAAELLTGLYRWRVSTTLSSAINSRSVFDIGGSSAGQMTAEVCQRHADWPPFAPKIGRYRQGWPVRWTTGDGWKADVQLLVTPVKRRADCV